MASHHLTIAKATFAASLLRPDVTKVDRNEVPHFHTLLHAAMLECSPANIQTCKEWLMRHIVPSASRTNAFLRYATVLARHASVPEDGPRKTTIHRQRLHLLYLLHDTLHEAKFHARDATMQSNMTQACQSSTVELFRLATSESKSRTRQRLHDLIDIWESEALFSRNYLNQLRQTVANPAEDDAEGEIVAGQTTSASREMPYMMPASHGDPSLPFYELPAGNFMPHIHPNKAIPMQPDSIRPLQFSAGPADESLVNAVKEFLKDVADMDSTFQKLEEAGITPEMDELGQLTYRNEVGDQVGDTYYGWSRPFCEKMKARRKVPPKDDNRRSRSRTGSFSSRSRSSSRSRNRSRTRSPRKRQRYTSRSRSSSRDFGQTGHGGLGAPPRRELDSRSASPPPRLGFRNNSDQSTPAFPNRPNLSHYPPPPPPSLPSAGLDPRFSHLPPPPFVGPDGIPIPPPRPPNWSGPWPPPPPPPPGQPNFDAQRSFQPYGGRGGR